MNFANPSAFWWFAIAVPIVVFYILKISLRRYPVSTVMFWEQIFEQKQPRSIWEQLKHLLSLLAQLAILSFLVFSLADPFFDWEVRDARRLVLVIDNSASMRATDVEPSRFAAAKTEALSQIDSLRQRDEMAIVAAGSQPTVLCGMTGHQRTLSEAIDAVSATDGPTQVAEAVALARRLLADHENGKVVILSDGGFEDAAKFAEAEDVDWSGFGKSVDNVALTRLQVRRSLLDPVGYQVLTEVRNFSDEPVECRLELDLDDEVVDVIPLKLEPNGTWTRVFDKTSTEGGRLLAKLDRDDALLADNQAWALLPKREQHRVILVTEGNLFLQMVFEANPIVNLTVTADPPKSPPAGTLVIYHKKVPNPVPPGNVVVIQPEAVTDLWEMGEKLASPIITKEDKDSPLMAHVRLNNVVMPEAYQLKISGKTEVLAAAVTEDPIYFVIRREAGNVLVLTADLDQGDLPLRTAFPIMITNAIGWFAGSKGELRESLASGSVTQIELPGAVSETRLVPESSAVTPIVESSDRAASGELVLRDPHGKTYPLPAGADVTTIGPLDQTGIWSIVPLAENGEVSPEAKPLREIACNLHNPRESDLRLTQQTQSQLQQRSASFGGRPVWFYGLVCVWLLIGVEWYLYQRRWMS